MDQFHPGQVGDEDSKIDDNVDDDDDNYIIDYDDNKWLFNCVAITASMYGPVSSWPGDERMVMIAQTTKLVTMILMAMITSMDVLYWCWRIKFQRCDDHDENVIDRIQHINTQSECQVSF